MGIIEKAKEIFFKGKATQTYSNEAKRLFTSGLANWKSINRFELDQLDIWDLSDSTKLANFYFKANITKYPSQPLGYRNQVKYFWSQAQNSEKLKFSTTNFARTVRLTLQNITGTPKMYSTSDTYKELVSELIEQNDLDDRYKTQIEKTLVQGWGAYRIDISPRKNQYPKIRYFDAHNSFPIIEDDEVVAICYTSYYKWKEKTYVLLEIRYVEWYGDTPYSCIDKICFNEDNLEDIIPLEKCDFLVDKEKHIEFEGVPFILGEFTKFFNMSGYENTNLFGRGIFYGKIDVLDDLDEAYSIMQTAIRRSLPKTSYPVESVGTRNGRPQVPNDFTMDYIEVPNLADGDGKVRNATPTVVQPNIDVVKYGSAMEKCRENLAGGLISINDIGLNERTFFRDSAEAIRERSRQTLYTIIEIRKAERKILTSLLGKCLFFYEKVWEDKTPTLNSFKDYKVEIHYDKFLSPSKEQKIKVYLPMWQSNAISTERFVRTVYEDELSEEEILKEIEALDKQRALGNQGMVFNNVPRSEKTTDPNPDEIEKLSDNSGMNNTNRAKQAIQDI